MRECKGFEMMSSCDGLKLAGYYCIDKEHVKGIVQLVHGMAEHKERYYEFMEFLCSKGYACVIMDMRGHGKSLRNEEDLGYFYDAKGMDCVKDIHQLSNAIRKDHPHTPYFLFGHSMGSLLVRAYAKSYDDLDGLLVCGSPSKNIMTYPALKLVQLMTRFKGDRYRSKFIHRMAFSSYNNKFLENYSDNVWLSVNRENVDAYDQDPLCGFVFTLNGFQNLFRLLLQVYTKKGWNIRNNQMPILFLAGEEDPCIVSPSAYKEAYTLMKEVGYTNVHHVLFKGMRHEILLEKQQQEVYTFIEDWLYSNIKVK